MSDSWPGLVPSPGPGAKPGPFLECHHRKARKVRLAWCTPFARRSGIGEFSAAVDIHSFVAFQTSAPIFRYPGGTGGRSDPDPGVGLHSATEQKLPDYDAVFYNIGDHWGYHGDLVRLLRIVPGIVILHDASLTHLMMTELMKLSKNELVRRLSWLYGPQGGKRRCRARSGPRELAVAP